jgi:hypothetical protein
LQSTAMAAIRSSLATGVPMFIYAKYGGCKCSHKRPVLPRGYHYYKIDAKSHDDITCEKWEVE